MIFQLEFTKSALEDIEQLKKSGDKSTLKKLEKLLNELRDIQQQEQDNQKL